ncbi:MAG TPA: polyhydroxyalkanoic acid system family protein [Thermoanaerobaculia bacterium]|jgi:hypothetical protein
MRVAVPHHTTRENARQTVERKLAQMLAQFGHQAQEVDHYWLGDTLKFKGRASGFTLEGTLEVTDAELVIDVHVPLFAKPFESRIRHTVEKEAAAMFRLA